MEEKRKSTTLMIKPHLYGWLKQQSEKNKRNISMQLEIFLENLINEEDKSQGE
jgi:hypothetical protein